MSYSKTDKKYLRKTYLTKRTGLKPESLSAYNQQITRLFMDFVPWHRIAVMHTYLPILRRNEVNTWSIIDQVRTNYPSVRLATSKISEANTLVHFYLEKDTLLETNNWGVPQPVNADPISLELIDLVLVPMIIFDKNGNRIGYGKGHYDQFLAGCRPNTLKIGLCYFDPVSTFEIEATDVPMDTVVTPELVWEF